MSIRLASVALMLAAPAAAAPLCHDIRGLYTPCPPGKTAARPRALQRTRQGGPAPSHPAAARKAGNDAPAEAAAAPARPETFAHSRKLCRDTKGLYTPCPR